MTAIATASLFVVSLGYGVVVPLLPQLAGGRAATDATVLAWVFAAYSAAKISSQVPGGVWVDRVGPQPILLAGLAGFSLSLVGFLVRQSLTWFIAVRAVEGVATGIVYPAVFALGLTGVPDDVMGRRIGVLGAIGTSGALVGPALGGLLAPYGPHLPVSIALGTTLLMTAVVALMPRPPAAQEPPRQLRAELTSIGKLAKSVPFLLLVVPVAFNKLTYSAFQGLLPLWGVDGLHLATRGITGLFILSGVGFAVAQPIGGYVADRFGTFRVAAVAMPCQIIGLSYLPFAHGTAGFVAGYSVYVLAASVTFTATFRGVARQYGGEQKYGGVFGLTGTLTDLMVVAGPLLFINLYAGLAGLTFAAMAAVGLGCWLLYTLRSSQVEEALT